MASTHHGVVYTKKWVVDLILDVAGYVPGTGISDKVIIEPSALLSYDKFIANIVMALGVHRA